MLIADLSQQNTSSAEVGAHWNHYPVAQVLESITIRIAHPKLHHRREGIHQRNDASESSLPVNLLNKVWTLFRKSSTVHELFDINSCRSPPLSSFSPTYVSGGKKFQAQTDRWASQIFFNGCLRSITIIAIITFGLKTQTWRLCAPRSMRDKKLDHRQQIFDYLSGR